MYDGRLWQNSAVTKKFVDYYVKKGFFDNISEKNFSKENIKTLQKIYALRYLGVCDFDIRLCIKNNDEFIRNVRKKFDDLKKSYSDRNEFLGSFEDIQNKSGLTLEDIMCFIKEFEHNKCKYEGYMRENLIFQFPGFFGEYMLMSICRYLDEPLDTPEKIKCWKHVIDIIDEMDEPVLDEIISENLKRDDINWSIVEMFMEKSIVKVGTGEKSNIYEYTDILNSFEVTQKDIEFCDRIFDYMDSEGQIQYLKDVFGRLDDDFKVLSKKYEGKNQNENVFGKAGSGKRDSGIIDVPEVTIIGCEYKKILPFGNIEAMLDRFSSRIDEIKDSHGVKDIYVIKGIDSLPGYRKSKMSILNLGFSFVAGIREQGTENIPDGMRKFVIPAHKYVWYSSNGNVNLKSMIEDDVYTINFLGEKFHLSRFPVVQIYNVDYSDGKFCTYVPIE